MVEYFISHQYFEEKLGRVLYILPEFNSGNIHLDVLPRRMAKLLLVLFKALGL